MLKGSKYGISAHSYPNIDIANLTVELANQLRKLDFYDQVRGDELPGPVAFVLAEGAYGSGPSRAIKQMQAIVGIGADGVFGRGTMIALARRLAVPNGIEDFVVEYQAQRLLFEASLGEKWDHNKVGWARRLFHATAHALHLAGYPIAVASLPLPTPVAAAPPAPPPPTAPAPPKPPLGTSDTLTADELNARELARLKVQENGGTPSPVVPPEV